VSEKSYHERYHSVTPSLIVRNAPEMIDLS
jgi:hypothetical protein